MVDALHVSDNQFIFRQPNGIKITSKVIQLVKNLPAMQETWVQSLGQEDPLGKGMATHSSILSGEVHGQKSLAG